MRFVLTGRAVVEGRAIERRHIIQDLAVVGDSVVDSFMQGADVLVASRDDTRKAVEARALGKPVWSYTQLYRFWAARANGSSEAAALNAANTGRGPIGRQIANAVVGHMAPRQVPAQTIESIISRTGGLPISDAPKTVEPHPVTHPLSDGRRWIDL